MPCKNTRIEQKIKYGIDINMDEYLYNAQLTEKAH
jgi:hypothetical protein